LNGSAPQRKTMTLLGPPQGATNTLVYTAEVPADRPSGDYTLRIVPHRDGISVPLENSLIFWQR
jgi:glycogen phosphorylase